MVQGLKLRFALIDRVFLYVAIFLLHFQIGYAQFGDDEIEVVCWLPGNLHESPGGPVKTWRISPFAQVRKVESGWTQTNDGWVKNDMALKIDTAIAQLEDASKTRRLSVDERVLLGSCLNERQRFEDAKGWLTEVIDEGVGRADAYYLRSRSHFQSFAFDKSLFDISKAIELEPGEYVYYFNRGLCFDCLRKPDLAISDLQIAIEMKPQEWHLYLARAIVFQHKRDFEKSLADVDKAIELSPDRWDARCFRAEVLRDMRRYGEAIDELEFVLVKRPKYDHAMAVMSWILAASPVEGQRDGARALRLATDALQLKASAEGFLALAGARAESGDFENAVSAMKDAIEIEKSSIRRSYFRRILESFERKKHWYMDLP